MKKKHCALLLAASAAACALLALTACKDSVTPPDNRVPNGHTHSWGDWTTQAAACTENGKRERKCSECGEIDSETLPATGHKWESWTTDDLQHWQICANGCGTTTEKTDHAYNGQGVCTACATVLKGTDGLEYLLTEDGNGYAVRLGTATQANSLVIPYTADDGVHGVKPVTTIEDYEANGMQEGEFQSLFVPSSVRNVGGYAFYNCKSLKTATVEGAVGIGMFWICPALEKVTVKEEIETIPEEMFYKCYELKEVILPHSVKNIETKAFYYCSSLASFRFEENVNIGEQAFYYSGLKSVDLPKGSKVGKNAFLGCYSITRATIASTTLGSQAFSVGKQLTDLTLLEGIEEIGEIAFSGIGVKSVVIPDSVKSIGERAFNGCKNLMHVTLGKNVTSIGKNAFSYVNTVSYSGNITGECYRLVDIKNNSGISVSPLTCDDSNGNLGKYALNVYSDVSGKSALSVNEKGYIFYDDGETAYFMEDTQKAETVELPSLSQNREYGIYPHAFEDNTAVKTVIFANGVNEIGEYAFKNCENLSEANIKNTQVKSIGKSAFYGCTKLYRFVLPVALETIASGGGSHENAFVGCDRLVEIVNLSPNFTIKAGSGINGGIGSNALNVFTLDDGINRFAHTDEGFTFYEKDANEYLLIGYDGAAQSLTLNGRYQGKNYTIGKSAFYGNTTLQNVVIDTSIDSNAFANCTSLTSVIFQSGVTKIGNTAFQGCSKLENITIPANVINIGAKAFKGCSKLKSVTFENKNGWQYSDLSNFSFSNDIPASDLADAESAAKYLTNDYSSYYWRRK